jgi:hypothetical protein
MEFRIVEAKTVVMIMVMDKDTRFHLSFISLPIRPGTNPITAADIVKPGK